MCNRQQQAVRDSIGLTTRECRQQRRNCEIDINAAAVSVVVLAGCREHHGRRCVATVQLTTLRDIFHHMFVPTPHANCTGGSKSPKQGLEYHE